MSGLLQKHLRLKECAEEILAEIESPTGLASEVLQAVVLETIKRYQQKVNAGIQDSVSDLLDDFKVKTSEIIIENAAGWRLAAKNSFLFPRNCRYCFSKGKSTVVVIEQEPQIRSLLFNENMLGEKTDTRTGDTERLLLSLPYMVFIFVFNNQNSNPIFVSLKCGWRTSPLSSLEDYIGQPLLPNIHDNLTVCLGTARYNGSMAEQIDQILTQFWHSQFNQDLSSNWWNKHIVSPKLLTGRTWAQESLNDPLFILGLNFHHQKTIKYLIESSTQLEFDADENRLKHMLAENVDRCASGLFAKISQYIKRTKFEKYEPTSIVTQLADFLKKVNGELHDVVLAISSEIAKISGDTDSLSNKKEIKGVSPNWRNNDLDLSAESQDTGARA